MQKVDIAELRRLHEAAKEEQIATLTELQSFREHTTALAADNERLRKALERSITALVFADTPESKAFHFGDLVAQLRETIAATPAQSLAAHDEALLREVARQYESKHVEPRGEPSDNYDGGYHDGQYDALNWLMLEVARIKKEATNG